MEVDVEQGIGKRLKSRAYRFFGIRVNYDSAWRAMMEKQVKECRERLDIELQVLQGLLDNLGTLSGEAREKQEKDICQSTREIRLVGRCLAFYTSRLRPWCGGKQLGVWDDALGDKVLELLSRSHNETTIDPYKENCGVRYRKMHLYVPLWCNQSEEDALDDSLAIAK